MKEQTDDDDGELKSCHVRKRERKVVVQILNSVF